MANKTFWTPENDRRLDALVRNGVLLVPLEKAAEILATSFSTVHVEITRRGIKTFARHTFAWTPERKKMLRAMLDAQGELILPRANAAKIIGCDRSTLTTGLIALHGDTPDRVDSGRLKALATKEGHLTLPRHKAARKLSCSEKALRNAMRKLHLRGAPRFEWSADKCAMLAEMLGADGRLTVTNAAAARTIGCSKRALQNRLIRIRKQKTISVPVRRNKPNADTTAVGAVLSAMRGWLPRLAPMQVSAAVKAQPELASMGSERIGHRVRALSIIYLINEAQALQLALSASELFVADLSMLRRNLREAAQAMRLDLKDFAALIVKKPALALISGNLMTDRLSALSNRLLIDQDKTLSLVRRYPKLLVRPTDELCTRSDALADALQLPHATIAAATRRQPNLLSFYTDVLADHCRVLAQLTGQSFSAVTQAFIKNPAILQVRPQTVDANTAEAARLLRCDKARIIAAFFAKPNLLTMRPAHLAQRVQALSKIFELPHKDMMDVLLKYPYLLSFATENTAEKLGYLLKLSEAVGKPATPAEILAMVPMAFSYSKERIALRVEMARAGLGWKSVGAMLSLPDKKAASLWAQRAESIET